MPLFALLNNCGLVLSPSPTLALQYPKYPIQFPQTGKKLFVLFTPNTKQLGEEMNHFFFFCTPTPPLPPAPCSLPCIWSSGARNQIWAAVLTYTAAIAMMDPSIHCAGQVMEPQQEPPKGIFYFPTYLTLLRHILVFSCYHPSWASSWMEER